MTDTISRKCPYCGKKFVNKDIKFGNIFHGIPFPDCNCSEENAEKNVEREKCIRKKQKIKQLYLQAGFSRKLRSFRLKNLSCEHTETAKQYIKNFAPKRSKGLSLIGAPGNGKTTLATCIGKELVSMGCKVIIKTFNDYLGEMQQAEFAKDYKNKSWLLDQWTQKDLVIIDDFGREKYTETRLVNTFTFFDKLVNNCTSFILTANPESMAAIKEFPEFSAILDRIVGDCKKLVFTNSSYRRKDEE